MMKQQMHLTHLLNNAGAQRVEDCECPADYYFDLNMPADGDDSCIARKGTLDAPCVKCPMNSQTPSEESFSLSNA